MLLREAVIEVLFDARHGGYLQLEAIRETLYLPKVESPDAARTNASFFHWKKHFSQKIETAVFMGERGYQLRAWLIELSENS